QIGLSPLSRAHGRGARVRASGNGGAEHRQAAASNRRSARAAEIWNEVNRSVSVRTAPQRPSFRRERASMAIQQDIPSHAEGRSLFGFEPAQAWEYENGFHLTSHVTRLAKILAHF